MKFNLAWMSRSTVILLFVALLFFTGGLACRPAVSADDEGDEPKVADPATDRADGDGAVEDRAVDEKDPFAVPDGTADELLTYIKELHELDPPRESEEEFNAFVKKIIISSIKAADKILAGEATDEQHVTAIHQKLQMLGAAGRFGIKDAAGQRKAFLESLKKDERPAIAVLIKQFVLKERVSEWPKLGKDEKKVFVGELVAYLSGTEINGEHIGLVSEIGQAMEGSGDPQSAAEMYLSVLPIFQKSDDGRIVEYSQKFEAMARRLGLIGNEMELEGTLLDKSPFDWSAYKGKVVLVDFWATWCGPCVAEMPNVKNAYAQYHEKGFDVVGISLDDNLEKVKAYVKGNEIPWVTLFSDDEAATGSEHPMAAYYGISGIPAMILVGPDGKVITLSARGPELGEHLQELLGDPLPIEENEGEDGIDGDRDDNEDDEDDEDDDDDDDDEG